MRAINYFSTGPFVNNVIEQSACVDEGFVPWESEFSRDGLFHTLSTR